MLRHTPAHSVIPKLLQHIDLVLQPPRSRSISIPVIALQVFFLVKFNLCNPLPVPAKAVWEDEAEKVLFYCKGGLPAYFFLRVSRWWELSLNSQSFYGSQSRLRRGVKVSSVIGLSNVHFPYYSKTLGQLSPLPSPFSILSIFLLVDYEITRQMQMC